MDSENTKKNVPQNEEKPKHPKIREKIKLKRIENNLTLEELGEKIGVSKQTIQRYENGVISNIPSDKIEKLAYYLETTPSFLMDWSEDSSMVSLNDHEKEVLFAYRNNPSMQTAVDILLGISPLEDETVYKKPLRAARLKVADPHSDFKTQKDDN